MTKPTAIERLIRQFADHRQLASTYQALARDQLRAAKDCEDRLQRTMARKPLSAAEKRRLTVLIETGEIEYQLTNEDGEVLQ